jgi:16S rRNA (uracil1498-N3)-methyltransferase
MFPPRLFSPAALAPGVEIELSEDASRHVAQVLRMRRGDALTLFDGCGGEYDAVIGSFGKRAVTVAIAARRELERESTLKVTLAQGVSAGNRMDFTVQKAIELGVSLIQPLATRRSVPRLAGARAEERVAHWQRVAISACEQCGRNRVPTVAPLQPLADWLEQNTERGAALVLLPGAPLRLRELSPPEAGLTLCVGPEGGFSSEEQALTQAAGFQAVRLGSRVLRTETAALAALSAMQALWGDF